MFELEGEEGGGRRSVFISKLINRRFTMIGLAYCTAQSQLPTPYSQLQLQERPLRICSKLQFSAEENVSYPYQKSYPKFYDIIIHT